MHHPATPVTCPATKLLLLGLLFTWVMRPSAEAAIIYSGPLSTAIPQDPNGIYLNPLSGTTTSYPGDWNTAPWINSFFGGVYIGNSDLLRSVVTGTDQIINLPLGTLINSLSTFAAGESGSSTHIGAALNQFQLGIPGYIGFAFEPNTGGSTHYGWMSLTINNSGVGTLLGYAYDDTAGAGIEVGATGAVPEPSRALMLLLGALRVMLRRKRAISFETEPLKKLRIKL